MLIILALVLVAFFSPSIAQAPPEKVQGIPLDISNEISNRYDPYEFTIRSVQWPALEGGLPDTLLFYPKRRFSPDGKYYISIGPTERPDSSVQRFHTITISTSGGKPITTMRVGATALLNRVWLSDMVIFNGSINVPVSENPSLILIDLITGAQRNFKGYHLQYIGDNDTMAFFTGSTTINSVFEGRLVTAVDVIAVSKKGAYLISDSVRSWLAAGGIAMEEPAHKNNRVLEYWNGTYAVVSRVSSTVRGQPMILYNKKLVPTRVFLDNKFFLAGDSLYIYNSYSRVKYQGLYRVDKDTVEKLVDASTYSEFNDLTYCIRFEIIGRYAVLWLTDINSTPHALYFYDLEKRRFVQPPVMVKVEE